MKFCIQCGNQLSDTARFCHRCGAPTEAPVVQPPVGQNISGTPYPDFAPDSMQYYVEPPRPTGKPLPKKLIAAILAVVLVIAAVTFLVVNHTRTIHLGNYVVFETETGYSGYGVISASFDYEAFAADYSGKLKVQIKKMEDDALSEYAWLSYRYDETYDIAMIFFFEYVYGSLDQATLLTNGDVVTWTWGEEEVLSTCFNYKVDLSDVTYTISNLEEVESIDIFEYISLDFSGYSGYGSASISVNDMLSTYYFELSESSSLSNGDVITVTFDEDYIQTLICNYGLCPAETGKNYVVSGLEEVQLIDLADCVTVSFSGISGDGYADIEVSEEYYGYWFYNSKGSSLSNGDVITISVDEWVLEELARETGKTFSSTSFSMEVSGLSEYVTSLAELEASDYMDELKDAVLSIYADNTNFTAVGEVLLAMEYVGSYFVYGTDGNRLYLVYKLTGQNPDTDSFTCYWYCGFTDLVEAADGTFSTDTSSYLITSTSKNKVTYSHYIYAGFYTVSDLYSYCIETYVDNWVIESSIPDALLAETVD